MTTGFFRHSCPILACLLLWAMPVYGQVHPVSPNDDTEQQSIPAPSHVNHHASRYSPYAQATPYATPSAPPASQPADTNPSGANTSDQTYLRMLNHEYGKPGYEVQPATRPNPDEAPAADHARKSRTQAPASQPMITPPDNDVYVGVIDNHFFKQSDMAMRVNRLLVMTDQIGWKDNSAREAMRQKLENMVLMEWAESTLLAAEAEQEGDTATDDEVQQKLTEIYAQESKTPEIQRTMQAIGISHEELAAYVHDAILAEKLIDAKVQERLQDKDKQAFYQMMPGVFVTPDRAELNYMVLRLTGKESLAEKRRLEGVMEDWRKKASRRGQFTNVAKDFNQPQLGQQGGYFGWATPNTLPRASASQGDQSLNGNLTVQPPDKIVESVFRLKPGEITPVLMADNGFYVFQLIQIQAGTGRNYASAKPAVDSAIYEEVKQAELNLAAPRHVIYLNTSGLDFKAIAEAKSVTNKSDLIAMRENERKQKFMEHFRDRILQAQTQGKAVVQREATGAPAEIPQSSLDILRRAAASHPDRLAAP